MRVTCRRLKTEVEIVVDDDGPGIRAEALEKIFERFYTDRPHQGFGQNSGLGLSISKQIVEAHGGRIWAENRQRRRGRGRDHRGARRALHRAAAGDVMAAETPTDARLGRAGRRARRADPRPGRGGQIAARARADRAAQAGLLRFARLVADDRVHLEAVHGACWCARRRRWPA